MKFQNRHSLMRSVIVALITVSLAATGISRVCAQDGDDIARELLRALIESRLDRVRPKRDPFRPPPSTVVTEQVRQLRTISATLAQEASALSAVINTDAARDFHVRRHLPAVLQFEASTAALRHLTGTVARHQELADHFRQLNAEWLTLSYQLRNQHGVSPQSIAVMDRIARLDERYCALLGIEQQFDSRELVRTADLLSASLHHLQNTLRYGVPATATRARLIRQLQQLQRHADYFAGLAADGRQLDVVVHEYRRLYDTWVLLEADLDRYSDRSVTRNVQQVVAVHQSIHTLLRLEFGLDRRLVLHLIQDVETTMSELFQLVTLADLMNLPDGDELSDAADTAYGTLHHLHDVVSRGESREEIGEAWEYMSDSWDLVSYYLHPLQRPEVRSHLDEVAGELTALRETVSVSVVWDAREMLGRASTLESLAEAILESVRRWHRSAGIADARRLQDASELIEHCHELEQLILARRPPASLRAECDHIVQSWQQLRPYLRQCQTAERDTLEQLAGQFTPELVRIFTSLPE